MDHPPTEVHNSFQSLVEADEGSNVDMQDVAEAFRELTANVQTAPRLTQTQARRQDQQKPTGAPKPLTRKQIMAIAQDIASGKITLPDISLNSNAEYEAVWALVDSGSRPNVADCARECSGHKIRIGEGRKQA